MKHCIIMTAYQDLEMINRFISKVPDDWGIYIHLDKKSSILKGNINTRAYVFQWYSIYWGASEHLYCIWRLIKTAHAEKDFDYYHIISGSDYFAKNPHDFDDILQEGKNYISITSIPHNGWAWNRGLDIFQYKSLNSFGDTRHGFWYKASLNFDRIQRTFRLKRKLPPYSLYHGLVYSSLHKDFINWAISSPLAEDLIKRLKNTVVAEEVFFQTLIMNSPYKETVINNHLRFDDWSRGGGSPIVLGIHHVNDIITSNALFCRKVSSTESMDMLDSLNEALSLR